MNCFVEALTIADVVIPPDLSAISGSIDIGEIPAICKRVNVKWYGEGKVELGVEPVIVLYRTSEYTGHAKFVSDIGPLVGRIEIIGLIRLED